MFKNQLKYYRKSINISQEQIANKLGMTQQAYANYEQGIREPNIETIKKLCIIFDCTADELLEIDTPASRNKVNINNSFNNSTDIKIKL